MIFGPINLQPFQYQLQQQNQLINMNKSLHPDQQLHKHQNIYQRTNQHPRPSESVHPQKNENSNNQNQFNTDLLYPFSWGYEQYYNPYYPTIYPHYPSPYNYWPYKDPYHHPLKNYYQHTEQNHKTIRNSENKPTIKQQDGQSQTITPKPIKSKPKTKKIQINKKHRKNNISYYWSPEENKRYSQFLRNNTHMFSLSLSEKKNLRVNVMMSKKVKSRNAQQCHSHHQKMIKKYGDLQAIIQAMSPQKKLIDIQTLKIEIEDQIVTDTIKKQQNIEDI